MSHTKGPWFVVEVDKHDDGTATCLCVSRYEDDSADAICWVGESYPSEEQEANAMLLASAPDLLAACKAVNIAYATTDMRRAIDLLREAIAKAEAKEKPNA
jgi:hypothetical protein